MTEPKSTTPAAAAAALANVSAPNLGKSTSPVPLQGPLATLDDAYRYAYAMAQSGLLPKALQNNPSNTLIIILYGQYLGIPPVVATQVISVVNGRPQIEGKMLIAKVREAGHKYRPLELTDTKSRVRITRHDEPDEPYEAEFTLDEAVKAGLCSVTGEGKVKARSKYDEPMPWELYTKDMLQWRATARCVNIACPEIKMGLAVEGEFSPAEQGPERSSLAAVAAQRDKPAAAPSTGNGAVADTRSDTDIAQQVADLEAAHTPPVNGEVVDDTAPRDTETPDDRWDEVLAAEKAEESSRA